MFILGDMIKISETEERLPLPWWHRAPLAFESGTRVYVALTEKKQDPEKNEEDRPGDILISVLDFNHWDKMIRIRCEYIDAPGVIAKVFGITAELNWNITVTETVTVKGGRIHMVDLSCEPYGQKKDSSPDTDPLKKALADRGFKDFSIDPFKPLDPPMQWHGIGQVDSRWVTSRKPLPWKQKFQAQTKELGLRETDFDPTRLVVSADTDNRLLRFVIPRRGARNVIIEHADEPGALKELTDALQRTGLNVLSSLTKRGGVPAGNAMLVAVCEPFSPISGKDEAALDNRIQTEIAKIPGRYRPELEINTGRRPETVVYSRHRDETIIHVPRHLKSRVADMRTNFNSNTLPVFLSQRFIGGELQNLADEVRRVLNENKCEVVQAQVLPGGTMTSFDEVSSAMWAARAGVVLVAGPDDESQVAFSLNLVHEFGFLQGQGKPLLLLVEDQSKALGDLDRFTNAKGVTAPRFSRNHAFQREHLLSIQIQIEKLLKAVRSSDLFNK